MEKLSVSERSLTGAFGLLSDLPTESLKCE